MLYWGLLIIIVLSFVLYTVFDFEGEFLLTVAAMCIVVFLILTPILIFNGVTAHNTLNMRLEDRLAIEAKISTGLYTDKLDLLDKDIIDDIRVYNKKIKSGKELQHNFWLGVFYVNIYDELDVIDYNSIKINSIDGSDTSL